MNAHINNFIRFGLTFGRGSMAVLCSRCRGDVADEQEVTCVMSEGNGCSACVERAAIRDKIKRLEEEITKLKAKYHALGTAMNTIHDPFIHKLPPEIGSHIFYLYLPTFYPRQTFSARALKAFFRVLRLGAVCRKWRQLAWATPNLWETLSIVTSPERIRTRGRSWPGLIDEWLGRSGGLPLSIFFFHDQDDFSALGEFDGALEQIIEVLALHSSRWRDLHLEVDCGTLEHFSGAMHLDQLLRLTLVTIDNAPERSSRPVRKIVMKSKPFPMYLRVENLTPTSIDIGWKNLTDANLGMLTTDECAEILRQAPALEHLHVDHFLKPDGPSLNVDSFIIHSRICSLDLPAEANFFLNMINVPSLEEWTQDAEGDTLPVMTMVSLLKRSSCCLKILNLDNLPPLFISSHILP